MTQSILIYYSSNIETLGTSVNCQSQLIHADVDWRQNTGSRTDYTDGSNSYTVITNHCQSSVHLFLTWTGSERRAVKHTSPLSPDKLLVSFSDPILRLAQRPTDGTQKTANKVFQIQKSVSRSSFLNFLFGRAQKTRNCVNGFVILRFLSQRNFPFFLCSACITQSWKKRIFYEADLFQTLYLNGHLWFYLKANYG